MKGLRKYLTPFAPDQSGAVGVLYELGGIIVICDAGGCAGNICGFDEPRWFGSKSAVFSAGLRDMDAILGRDDMLVDKLKSAAEKLNANFAAIIGTPVPAVIGTDYKALCRMTEKRTGLPAIGIDTDGTWLYDKGEEKTWKALFQTFASAPEGDAAARKPEGTMKKVPVTAVSKNGTAEETVNLTDNGENGFAKSEIGSEKMQTGSVGVIGLTPLSVSDRNAGVETEALLKQQGWKKIYCYGMGAGIEDIRTAAGKVEKNMVVSPAGKKAAAYLKKKFGTPYELWNPLAEAAAAELLASCDFKGKRILIVEQQVTAATLRTCLHNAGAEAITNATWFMQLEELTAPGDVQLAEEDDFAELVRSGNFDIILADPVHRQMIPDFQGVFIERPQFAVSGNLPE